MNARITIQTPSDQRFVPKNCLTEWQTGGFVERKKCLEIWDYVQETVKDVSRVGVCLEGPSGVGKSSIMYYVVHKARELGWFVIYIPRCDDWMKAGDLSPAGRYTYFFDAVLVGLQFTSDEIKEKYSYCIPPNDHTSWTRAELVDNLTMTQFEELFVNFCDDIRMETDVEVILASDESQALFEKGAKPWIDPPFHLMNWTTRYNRGCVFFTASADSICFRLRSGYERFIVEVGALSDEEVISWFQTEQFANVSNHPDFTEEFIPDIRSLTGDIPRELVLLNMVFACQRDLGISETLSIYNDERQSEYLSRFVEFVTRNPDAVSSLYKSLMKFFVQVSPNVDYQFMDTGLAYRANNRVVALNANATKVFFKLVNSSSCGEWNKAILQELKDLKARYSCGLQFQRLFVLNVLSADGAEITLNYYNLAGVKERRCIQIVHFLTLLDDESKSSWREYPLGTLVVHSKIGGWPLFGSGEEPMGFIYFGGESIIFFELTVATDVSEVQYPNRSTDNKSDLILNSVTKRMGCPMRLAENETLEPISRESYNGTVEYIMVSARTHAAVNSGIGHRKKEEFAWLKIMDIDGLAKIFPESHIESLRVAMSKLD